jgi:hypothetical protein
MVPVGAKLNCVFIRGWYVLAGVGCSPSSVGFVECCVLSVVCPASVVGALDAVASVVQHFMKGKQCKVLLYNLALKR